MRWDSSIGTNAIKAISSEHKSSHCGVDVWKMEFVAEYLLRWVAWKVS